MFPNRYNKPKRENHFFKLGAGESAVVVVRPPFHEFKQHWPDGAPKPEICTGDKNCHSCAQGEYANFRFRVNLVLSENKQYVSKILEQGRPVYKQLAEISLKCSLSETPLKITRHGSGKETQYEIVPSPSVKLSAEDRSKIEAVELRKIELPAPRKQEDQSWPTNISDQIGF